MIKNITGTFEFANYFNYNLYDISLIILMTIIFFTKIIYYYLGIFIVKNVPTFIHCQTWNEHTENELKLNYPLLNITTRLYVLKYKNTYKVEPGYFF